MRGLFLLRQHAQFAIGVRNRAFGHLERIRGFGAVALGLVDFILQGLDAGAQVLEFVAGRRDRACASRASRAGEQAAGKQSERVQTLAFPCAATAACALAISSGSAR